MLVARAKNGRVVAGRLPSNKIESSSGNEAAALRLPNVAVVHQRFGDKVAGHHIERARVVGVNDTFARRYHAHPGETDEVGVVRIDLLRESGEIIGGRQLPGQNAVVQRLTGDWQSGGGTITEVNGP